MRRFRYDRALGRIGVTEFLLSTPANRRWLMDAIKEVETGRFVPFPEPSELPRPRRVLPRGAKRRFR